MSMPLLNPVAIASMAVAYMSEAWGIAADLLGGTKAMRVAGIRHLPKWPKEEQKNYDNRLKASTLFPAYSRTITTLAAKPFSRPVTLNKDIPAQLTPWLDDIDMMGRSIAEFGADMLVTALGYGMGGILVDAPVRNGVANTQAAEKAAGVRPYFAKIMPTDLLGWIVEVINGKPTLTQVRFYETVEEKGSDGFSTKTIRQIKVIEIGKWAIWRENPFRQWVQIDQGTTTIDFVPFVPVYGEFLGFMTSKPPLIELAYLNIKHWQSQSDQDNLLHFARVPILAVATDDTQFQLVISGNVAVRIPADAKLSYTEHEGKALGSGKTALDDLKDEMRQSGAELLVFRDAPATATEIDNDASVGTCALQRVTQGLQDSLIIALDMMAKWIRITSGGGTLKLFNEFGAETMDDALNQLLVGLPDSHLLSRESTYGELQRRWNLNPGVTWAQEKVKIDADATENQARAVENATQLAAIAPKNPADAKNNLPAGSK